MSSVPFTTLPAQEIRSLVVHCKASSYDVYIGRPSAGAPKNTGTSTCWGNPFPMRNQSLAERRRVTEEYRKYLYSNPDLMTKARLELKGKVLACWCSPKDCHGHVLASVANSTGSFPTLDGGVELCVSSTPIVNAPASANVYRSLNQTGGVAPTSTTTNANNVNVAQSNPGHENAAPTPVSASKKRRQRKKKNQSVDNGESKSSVIGLAPSKQPNQPTRNQISPSTNTATTEKCVPLLPTPPKQAAEVSVGVGTSNSTARPKFPRDALIDVGVNLTSGQFRRDAVKVVERAAEAGVSPLIVTGLNLEASQRAMQMCDSICESAENKVGSNGLYFTAGVHPHEAKSWNAPNVGGKGSTAGGGGGGVSSGGSMKQRLLKLASHPRCVAIGECGLDFNRNYSSKTDQMQCFREQLEVACEVGLPVFCHEREAHSAFIEVVSTIEGSNSAGSSISKPLPPIVVHCFTGTLPEAKKYLALGFYIGLAGFICMDKRGQSFREEVLPFLPLNKILLETDAPFMHPTATGRNRARCEPFHTIDVCLTVAKVLNVSPEKVAKQTTENSKRFFRLQE